MFHINKTSQNSRRNEDKYKKIKISKLKKNCDAKANRLRK